MTEEEATKRYLSCLIHSKAVINRIVAWNHALTLIKNSKALGISINSAWHLAYKYKLKYKVQGKGKYERK